MNNQITTAEKPISKAKDEVIKEAQRIEESALYSAKSHLENNRDSVDSNC